MHPTGTAVAQRSEAGQGILGAKEGKGMWVWSAMVLTVLSSRMSAGGWKEEQDKKDKKSAKERQELESVNKRLERVSLSPVSLQLHILLRVFTILRILVPISERFISGCVTFVGRSGC